MEATLLEIPAIAFSNAAIDGVVNWATPEAFTAKIIRKLVTLTWPHGVLMNVNFPALPPERVKAIISCAQGRRKLDDNLHRRIDPHGKPYIWIGGQRMEPFSDEPMADYRQILDGYITVTPLDLDLTNYTLLADMRGIWEAA
jgi:5'-nucleotidase